MSMNEPKLSADDAWSEIQKIVANCDDPGTYAPAAMIASVRQYLSEIRAETDEIEALLRCHVTKSRLRISIIETMLGAMDGTKLQYVTRPEVERSLTPPPQVPPPNPN